MNFSQRHFSLLTTLFENVLKMYILKTHYRMSFLCANLEHESTIPCSKRNKTVTSSISQIVCFRKILALSHLKEHLIFISHRFVNNLVLSYF